MSPHKIEDSSTLSDVGDETSEVTNGLQYPTEQLDKMKLDDQKADDGVISHGNKEASIENGAVKEAETETGVDGVNSHGIEEAPVENSSEKEAETETKVEGVISKGIEEIPVKNSAEQKDETKTDDPDAKKTKSVSFAFEQKTADPEDSDVEDKPATEGKDLAKKDDEPKKKKKKSRSGKKPRPSGFEEFYADPPITPDEAIQEKEILYDPDRGFAERIEVCIQRYRARRKFDSERGNIFTKFMVLGGIDSEMKPFTGGLDNELLTTGTKDEIAAFAAVDYVGTGNIKYYQPSRPDEWIVDFEGVVKGFLSHRAPEAFDLHTEEGINQCCNVVKNFLNYVLMHGVCPEYTQELLNARVICDQAKTELWTVFQLRSALPGAFHKSCAMLYGSSSNDDDIDGLWMMSAEDVAEFGMKITKEEAQRIVKTAIALKGTKEMFRGAVADKIHVVKEEDHSYEVVEIIRADSKVQHDFANAKDINGVLGGMKPLGILRVKHFDNPDLEEEDRSDDGYERPIDYVTTEDFWLEDDILEKCFIGLKMHVQVHELNIGLKYFDVIHDLYVSFITILPQELMRTWTDPEINPRGPPTVENPFHEEPGGDDGLSDDEKE